MEYYDSDRKFPVYGFGGKPFGESQVSHCFALNGNPGDPEVLGTHGILQIYRQTLSHVRLYGPTFFVPILQQVIRNVKSQMQTMMYHIFLILTDGEIHDMQETINQVVEAS